MNVQSENTRAEGAHTEKVVLVTGSSRGLGRAMALGFGRLGYKVAVHYSSSPEAAQAVAEEITKGSEGLETSAKTGTEVEVFGADVSQEDACVGLVKAVQERFGSLDVLVNNAGITKDGLTLRLKSSDWHTVIATNLTSAFFLSKTALRGMLANRWGRIVNVSSVVALSGNAGQANYVASKAGLIGLTRALAQEYGAKGVTVNAVAPGFIDSDMTEGLPDEIKRNFLLRIAANRFGRPEEVAAAVVFLAGDGASYINGQTLTVDGGMVLH